MYKSCLAQFWIFAFFFVPSYIIHRSALHLLPYEHTIVARCGPPSADLLNHTHLGASIWFPQLAPKDGRRLCGFI